MYWNLDIWLELALMVFTSLVFAHFYILSLRPAKSNGETETEWRKRCTLFRMISLVALAIHLIFFFTCADCPIPLKWLRTFPWPPAWSSLLGFILLFVAAYYVLAGLWAAGRRTLLASSGQSLFGGIYLKLRHPQFLGFLIFLAAAALLADAPVCLAICLGWGFIIRLLIKVEDRNLETALGETYRDYRSKTGPFMTIATRAKPCPLTHCLNCAEELKGGYCHKCGQKGTESDVPLSELIREFLRDELKIDTRLNRTIVPLLFRPGLLTADYIAGRRIRYVPPLRIYVFVSLVMFFLLALGSRHLDIKKMVVRNEKGADNSETIDETIRELREAGLGAAVQKNAPSSDHRATPADRPDSPPSQRDEMKFFNRLGRAVGEGWKKARQEPERMLELAVEKFGHIMFLLLPIFALLLKLLYIRRNLYFMQHMIFALHFHAFMFFILSVILALNLWGGAFCKNQGRYLFWLVPFYLLMALKHFYRQGWLKTTLKFMLLVFNYGIVFSVGVALAFVFSLMSM